MRLARVLALVLVLAAPAAAHASFGFLTQWGSKGAADGQFDGTNDVASDGAGNIYVADTSNSRVQKFTSNGTFLTKWAVPDEPTGIAWSPFNGQVYVAGLLTDKIYRFNDTGAPLGDFGTPGTQLGGELSIPDGMDIDSAGSVWVADLNNSRVQKFDPGGTFQLMIGKDVGPGGAEVCTVAASCTSGGQGSGPSEFANNHDVAVDAAGNAYVTDMSNNRVEKFNGLTGTFITQWGTPGSGDGQLDDPIGIEVSGSSVYVGDTDNARVQVFDTAGTFTGKFGSPGSGPGQFARPFGIGADPAGNVYVFDAETFALVNERVQKFGEGGSAVPGGGGGDPGGGGGGDGTEVPPECVNPTQVLFTCAGTPRPTAICGSGILPPCPAGFTPPQVCVSIWVGDCEGKFPKPNPVEVCVSLWQDCTGFGGSKPANPGTIDLGGLPPAAVSPGQPTTVDCGTRPRASQGNPGVNVFDPRTCPTGIFIDVKAPLTTQREYDERVTYFRTYVNQASNGFYGAQGGPSGWQAVWRLARFSSDARKTEIMNRFRAGIDAAFGRASLRARPVDLDVTYPQPPCGNVVFFSGALKNDSGWPDSDVLTCLDVFQVLTAGLDSSLRQLQDEKARLGIDRAFRAQTSGAGAQASARRASYLPVLAGARTGEGKVRLRMTKQVRKLLRAKRRRGARRLRATATTYGSPIPGIAPVKHRRGVRLRLR